MEAQSFDGLLQVSRSPMGANSKAAGTFHLPRSNKQSLASSVHSKDENSFSLNSEGGAKNGTAKKDTLSN